MVFSHRFLHRSFVILVTYVGVYKASCDTMLFYLFILFYSIGRYNKIKQDINNEAYTEQPGSTESTLRVLSPGGAVPPTQQTSAKYLKQKHTHKCYVKDT